MKPFNEIVELANEMIPQGVTVIQNWKCGKCGDKVYMNEPNALYTSGVHTHRMDGSPCDYETDLLIEGCGLTAMMGTETPKQHEARWREAADAAGRVRHTP